MRTKPYSAYELAQRFIGLSEVPGKRDNPQILAMLKLDGEWPQHDEVPWCSAFVNYIAWALRLPRSKSLRARSWLLVGEVIHPGILEAGFDVVILKRAGSEEGPDVIEAPGHVGFFAGWEHGQEVVSVLGGNQSDQVSIQRFRRDRVLGYRRLA